MESQTRIFRKRKTLFQRLESKPALFFLLSYLSVNIIGGLLLALPWSIKAGQPVNILDGFFVATSALCVTGLTPVVTVEHWTLFGQIVVLALIQLGGLGIMTATAAFGIILRRRIGVQNRKILMEERGHSGITGIIKLIRFILISTAVIELTGTLLLAFVFVPEKGLVYGLWLSLFHAVSAFCNAGFDILGPVSLAGYGNNVLVVLTIAFLIIIAGLGYTVYADVLERKSFRRLKLHSKIVLSTTAVFLIGGTIAFLLLEWNNPGTLGGKPFGIKVLHSFFQSVTPRTAGYFITDQAKLTQASVLVTIFLMFIGGSPAGTAGGIKTTTLVSVFVGISGDIRLTKDTPVFHRNIAESTIKRAFSILTISLLWCTLVSFSLTISEPGVPYINSLYETVSAFGTVGLTRNLTPYLSSFGKLIIMATMLFGKLGPMTIVFALTRKAKPPKHREAEEPIFVG